MHQHPQSRTQSRIKRLRPPIWVDVNSVSFLLYHPGPEQGQAPGQLNPPTKPYTSFPSSPTFSLFLGHKADVNLFSRRRLGTSNPQNPTQLQVCVRERVCVRESERERRAEPAGPPFSRLPPRQTLKRSFIDSACCVATPGGGSKQQPNHHHSVVSSHPSPSVHHLDTTDARHQQERGELRDRIRHSHLEDDRFLESPS
jgi:hypothetical protein